MKSLIAGDRGNRAALGRQAQASWQPHRDTEYQRIQCELMRATWKLCRQIAQLLGWSMATVHFMHSRWAKQGEAIFDVHGHGGRRHQHLTPAQEKELLAPARRQLSWPPH